MVKNRKAIGWIVSAGMLAAFLFTLKLAWPIFQGQHFSPIEIKTSWIVLPGFSMDVGVLLNPLSLLMLLIVTGVGSAIFIYSLEYMEHDAGFGRYFAGLALFAFSMIGIVVSSNLLQLFIFWELVGVSSYLLIGHWYQKNEAADAGKKAFLTNRVGDFGFLLGILCLWVLSGPEGARSLNLLKLNSAVGNILLHREALTIALLLIFMGVMGKSAQFPLHVWLPDAMEGPTPVSALIHAATMVAAGVYLLARLFFLFHHAPFALAVIAYLGGFTALFTATQALVQNDIKRVLAYSTLSQLGYMVIAVGLGGSSAAMFHLTTHAFFKALLFLAAGSIIHATHEQDIKKMGGLATKLPVTSAVFLIGTFALVGFWPASGFWSKEEILALAFRENLPLFIVGMVTAFFTALYMGRVALLAFFGPSKLTTKPHEPGLLMILPLVLLSILSIFAGAFHGQVMDFLRLPYEPEIEVPHILGQLSNTVALFGVVIVLLFYVVRKYVPIGWMFRWLKDLIIRKYYIDDLYDFLIRSVQQPFARFLDWFEKKIIVEAGVNGAAKATAGAGVLFRRLQTGNVQTYLSIFFFGVVVMIYFLVVRT